MLHFVAEFVLVHLNVKSDDLSRVAPLSQLKVLLECEQVVRLSHLVRHAIVRHTPDARVPEAGEQDRSNSKFYYTTEVRALPLMLSSSHIVLSNVLDTTSHCEIGIDRLGDHHRHSHYW